MATVKLGYLTEWTHLIKALMNNKAKPHALDFQSGVGNFLQVWGRPTGEDTVSNQHHTSTVSVPILTAPPGPDLTAWLYCPILHSSCSWTQDLLQSFSSSLP